jgi:hypothetical protein
MVKHLLDLRRVTRETLDQLATASDQVPEGFGSTPSEPRPHADTEMNRQQPSPHLAREASTGVALQEAPERFFDPDDWNDFISGCGSREAALHRISVREDGAFVFVRRRAAEQPTPAGSSAREDERIAQLGQRILTRFRASLIKGERVTTGMQPPSIERIAFPAELWSQLMPNFEDATAEGGGYAFAHICVIDATDVAPTESEIVVRIAAWLGKRRERYGDELKKALVHAARDEFADEFKTRAFDVAYRRIYGRKQGRPPRSQGR